MSSAAVRRWSGLNRCLGLPGQPCDNLTDRSRCPECRRAFDRQQRPSRPGRGAWNRVRAAQLRRQPYCVNCGSAEDLTVDHVLPYSQGGSDDLENLMTLCRRCNSSKGTTNRVGYTP